MKKNNNPREIFNARVEQIDYTMDQKKALLLVDAFMQSSELFLLISGNAGTGKTTIAENIAIHTGAYILAPTNNAVKRLRDKILSSRVPNLRFSTIHQKMYGAPNKHTGAFIKGNGLTAKTYIIDETSMIDTTVLIDLLEDAKTKKCKLIFLGDDFQLEPISKDPKIFTWEESFPRYFNKNYRFKLNEVRRNSGAILEVATHLRSCNKNIEILNRDTQDFQIKRIFSNELALDIRDDKDFIVLVSTNKTRMNYNKRIRQVKFEEDCVNVVNDNEKVISVANNQFLNGEQYTIKDPKILKTYHKTINIGSKMYPKEKTYTFYLVKHGIGGSSFTFKTLLFPELDIPSLHSGQLCSDKSILMDNDLTVYNPGMRRRIWKQEINIATYGYATSVHKSQGNEWDHVYIDCDWLSDNWNKPRWMYTAITRARKKVELKISNQFKIID